ncbi:MAG: hypothetical protein ACP5MD_08335, partial [Verrucomicrobiia bacterium]
RPGQRGAAQRYSCSQGSSSERSLRLRLRRAEALVRKLEGHYAYYGITGNGRCLEQVRAGARRVWRKWLARRSRGSESLSWERMQRYLDETFVIPPVRIVHSIYGAKP